MANLYNSNLELTVLSCLFKDGSQWAVVEDILTKKSFKFPSHGFIFQAFANAIESELYPDIVVISAELEKKNLLQAVVLENGMSGIDALKYIANMESNIDNLESYAIQVQHLQANRQLLLLSSNIEQWVLADNPPFATLDSIDLETGKIATFIGSRSNSVKSANDVALSSVANYEETRKGNKKFIETGWKFWDSILNGLFNQRLYLIGARAGEGKSAFCHNLIKMLSVDKNYKIHIFSLEMSADEITNRLVQIMTGISPLDIDRGELKENEIPLYENAISKISKGTFTVDDSSDLSLSLLRTKARKAVAGGAQILMIDQTEQLHLGLGGDSQPEYIKINFITYRVKALSRELNVPIILLHQLNRGIEKQDGTQNVKRDPQLSDLAQSGEKAPDVVALLRTAFDPALFIVKNRQGKRGRQDIQWDGKYIRFSDPVEIFPDKLL